MSGKADPKTRTIARGGLAAPLPLRVRIVGSGSRRAGKSVRLAKGTVTLGAASTCDLVLEDPAVSRRHVELELVPEGVLVRDLGSHNGTYYLGQRVERIVLTPGTVLELGGTTIAIEIDPETFDGSQAPLQLAGFRGMVGTSEQMQRLFGAIARLDGSLVPTLLLGDTGTGKELVARALHEGSRVAHGPLVPVNCGALPRELVASALFGHKKGAFTGASEPRRGAFGAADRGTIFLDEIGELPLEVQPMLLRVLETGEVLSVGDDVARPVTVRIIAATNRDLAAEVRAGRFREDLFYRLAVVTLRIPPLRERPLDIAQLADLFARQEGCPGLPPEVVAGLTSRPFPGNVRELRNAVRAYVALGHLDDAPATGAPRPSMETSLRDNLRLDIPYLEQRDALVDRFTSLYLDRLLEETGGNQTAAAKIAGLDRTYFGRLLAKLGRH